MLYSTPLAQHQHLQAGLLKKQPLKDSTPGSVLKILSLEDTVSDQELLAQQLKKLGSNYQLLFAEDKAGFENALTTFNPDIILSDYNLPSYHGVDAFYTAKQQLPLVPFILVSGTIGEQRAVELIKGGVTDYVIKDALFTLIPVITRALKEATERREKLQAEMELKQTAERLARAQALAHLGSWETDVATGTSYWSDETLRIYGIEPGNNLQSVASFISFIHTDDREQVQKIVAESIAQFKDVSFYHRIVRTDGSVRYIHTEARNDFDALGNHQTLHGTSHDITENKLAEEKLHETEQSLAELFNNTADYIYSVDTEYRLTTCNKAFADNFYNLFGKRPVIGENFIDAIPENIRHITRSRYQKAFKGQPVALEEEYRLGDKHQWYSTRYNAIIRNGKTVGIAMFGSNITERKVAELKQRESEQAIKEIFENTTDYICSLDKDLNLVSYNEAYLHNFTSIFKREPVIGEYYLNILPQAQRAEAELKYREVLKGNVVINEAEYDFNGKHFWFITKFSPVRRNGQITGVAFFSTDITERKMAELKLRESEQNLKDVFDNTADFISSFDKDRRLLSCNKAFAQRFRSLANSEPVLGNFYPNMFANQPGAAPGIHFNRALKGESVSVIEEYQYKGNRFWFSVRYNPIVRNGQTTGVAIFSNDITESKLAADKLNESRAALKDVFDNTSDAIVSVDKEHRLLSFNKAFINNFTRITGNEPVMGNVYYGTTSAEISAQLRGYFNRALTGEQFTSVNQYTVGSKTYWYSVRYSPIMRSGQITGVAVFSSDITQQKNAETLLHKSFDELQIASEKQSAILNTLPANIALLDKNGVVIKVNDAWRRFAYENNMNHGNSGLGENYITVSESAGGPDASLAHQMAEGLKQVISGKLEKFSLEYPCHAPDKQRWFRAEVTPLEGYDELGAVVMHLDITDRNKAEAEVKDLNHHLEKKIAERTEQLEKANKEMEAFSYTVSHDLRSPLQVINGYASILERKYKPQLDEGAAELLTGIKDSTRKMSQLIADLLNFSHLGRAQLKRKPICMDDLVKVVVNELKANTPNFKHTITVLPLKGVTADAGLMHQVWVNLIANAIKYSSNKPNPTIEIGLTRINNEDVFYIMDNGAGFDMAYYHKLFTVFHRLHKPSEFEGTGVGLALVQSVITRHGGRVWAEAKVNQGATFYFTLPDAG